MPVLAVDRSCVWLPDQAVHAWPDNWKVSGADFMTQWVNCHIEASASLGKPMLLEEVSASCLLATSRMALISFSCPQ